MYPVRRQPVFAFATSPGGRAGDCTSADYRNAARRLRHRFRSQPARLHASLQKLSQAADQRLAVFADAPDPDAPAIALARAAVAAMDGPVLRYSARQALLRQAADLGLGRFEANLILAAVQYQRRGALPAPVSSSRRRLKSLLPAATLAIIIQTAIILAVWSILSV